MHKKTFARLFAIATAAASTLVACAQNAPATLTLHPDQPVSAVSPTLYGLMTEEINYSYDGGLYAEMVRNRTLRGDWSGILYWYLVENGNARAKMSHDATTGPSTALPNSLKIEIEQADAHNQAGALNVGWWGMALHHNTEYKGSFYAKADSASMGPISVSLVNDDSGKAVASATVNAVGTDWKQFTFTLNHAEDRRDGALVNQSPRHHCRPRGHALVAPGFAVSTDVSQPRKRQPYRSDG
jgi:alpha-N-arabinofuranosidase